MAQRKLRHGDMAPPNSTSGACDTNSPECQCCPCQWPRPRRSRARRGIPSIARNEGLTMPAFSSITALPGALRVNYALGLAAYEDPGGKLAILVSNFNQLSLQVSYIQQLIT